MKKLPREFYARDTITVAQDLLGKHLVYRSHGIEKIGKIVEVEAYLGPHDLAAHSARGLTERTKTMYGPPGHAYVYLIYGIHFCFNVVTEPVGHGAAVLVRAIEPVQNILTSTRGPGLLCKAIGITKILNGHDLLSENFFIVSVPNQKKLPIVKKPRIGVDYAKHWAKRLLRFYIKDNLFVSKK